jgi:ATP-binding protein involved in chromosome partitioning
MTSPAEIEQQLPPHIAPRIRSVRLADGVATLVADASGLSRAAAAELQRELEQLVGGLEGVAEVRVALMADKVRRQIVVSARARAGSASRR